MFTEVALDRASDPKIVTDRLATLLAGNEAAAFRIDGNVVALCNEGMCISIQAQDGPPWDFRDGELQSEQLQSGRVRTELAPGLWSVSAKQPRSNALGSDPYVILNRLNDRVRIDSVHDMETLCRVFGG